MQDFGDCMSHGMTQHGDGCMDSAELIYYCSPSIDKVSGGSLYTPYGRSHYITVLSYLFKKHVTS